MASVIELVSSHVKVVVSKYVTEKYISRRFRDAWLSSFIQVSRNSRLLPANTALHIARSRSAMRLFYSMLEQKNHINIRDLVTVIGIELLDAGINIDKKFVIQYAHAVYSSWIDELVNRPILRERIQQYMGSDIRSLRAAGDKVDNSELMSIIGNKTELRKYFFRTYSDPRESYDVVRVYIPNDLGYIDWNIQHSVDVHVNRFLEFDLGFFRVGYDYEFLSSQGHAWVVTLSKSKRKEAVSFGNLSIGRLTRKYIWLR